ncbi:polysaccharide pyruvyl transferase family protein [Methanofollis fontis]|uniref:polysaccharide pyruvyl transferase family protein n=1 Tax=Methanofollis fontis TaxID=2052832 RepID=UPI0013EEBB4C|nr:polysaccharide pyruvyl transferase family protein [Methanofollis fontis]
MIQVGGDENGDGIIEKNARKLVGVLPQTTRRRLIALYKSTRLVLDGGVVLALWYPGTNWGDALNPVLIQEISGKKPLFATQDISNIRKCPVYSVIGSVLEHASPENCGNGNLVVWGTGFLSERGRLRVRPREICAVRGPLTRELLLRQGFSCPEVYGDPALLYPEYYRPKLPKRYQLGIIPHYVDKNHRYLQNFQDDPGVLVIDIQGGIRDVVDQICRCRHIASSSLHGIIASDAYRIPSTWVRFSDGVAGKGFKFNDYFSSVGREEEGPYAIEENTSVDDLLDICSPDIPDPDLKALREACPFRKN